MTTRNRPGIGREVLSTLKAQIESGHWKNKLPAIDALAKEFAVNRKTIDRALMILVRDGSLVRQRGVGTFIAGTEPEFNGKTRKVNTRRYAALADTQTTYPGYMDLLHGCNEAIKQIDGSLLFVSFDTDEDDKQILGRLRTLKLEGILLCGPIRPSLLRKIQREFNILLVDSHSESPPVDSITWECRDAGYRLAQAVINSDCKSVLLLELIQQSNELPENHAWFHQQRIRGLKEALDESKLNYMEYQIGWSFNGIADNQTIIKYLSEQTEQKALITSDAAMVIPVFKKAGCLAAINDVMLYSFADARSLTQAFPGIYAMHDMHMMGNEAGKMLTDIIGRPSQKTHNIKLVPEIVEIK